MTRLQPFVSEEGAMGGDRNNPPVSIDTYTADSSEMEYSTEDDVGLNGLNPLVETETAGDMKSMSIQKNDEEEAVDDEEEAVDEDQFEFVELTEDIYSFLLIARPLSGPFLFAISVLMLQNILFILILIDIIDLNSDNPMQIPPGVESAVSVAQFLLLPIAVAVEADMIRSVIMFHNGYNPEILKSAPAATYGNWLLACFLKFGIGGVALFTNFTLMIQSTKVVEMILNFAALSVVSSSSVLAFELAQRGFMWNSLQSASNHVSEIKYPNKSGSNILRRVVFLIIWLGLISGWSVCLSWQRSGRFLCSTLAIQFGDETTAALGAFSGTFVLDAGKKYSGRVVYKDEKSGNAMFAYCKAESAWTFSFGTEDLDPCKFEAISPETQTYDIIDISAIDWLVGNSAKDAVPFQFASIICFECEESDTMTCTDSGRQCKRGMYGLQCQFSEPCGSLDVLLGTRFRYSRNSELYQGLWQSGEFFSPILSGATYVEGNTTYERYLMVNERPVFAYEYSSQVDYAALGLVNQSGLFELLLFNGRRWIFTTSEELQGLKKSPEGRTDTQRLIEYFASFHSYFSEYGALFISDPTDYGTPTESGTPERLSWYRVAPETNNQAEKSLDSDVVFLCSCSKEYPCFSGLCTQRIGDYNRTYSACDCVQGFGGSLCQELCNEGLDGYFCDEPICGERVPCVNGGSCTSVEDLLNTTSQVCDCPQGFGSRYCERECPPGKMGFDCDESFCTDIEPCQNGGVCKSGMSDSIIPYAFQYCDCIQGFGGNLCETTCPDGYYGTDCDFPICNSDVPCVNGGICDVRPGASNTTFNFCACPQGLGGPLCNRTCRPGYGGFDCDDTYCGSEFPCNNGGSCKTTVGESGIAYTFCSCPEGFGGAFCDDPCPPGYTGLFCDEVACSRELPCDNEGICKSQTSSSGSTRRYCACPLGFGGSLCQDECPPGFSGLFCNEQTCGSVFPCENGGICETVTEGSIVSSSFCNCTTNWGGFFCEESCPYGFSGPFCDVQSECSLEVPCLNDGICREPSVERNETWCDCQQGRGGRFCELICPPGFTGTFCDEQAECREAGRWRCLNGGLCVQDENTTATRCECPLGFGGFLCDRTCPYGYTGYYCDQRACNDIFPCLNNGTCVVTEIGTPNVTACECPKGTIGFFCEVICPYGYYGEDCFFRDDCSDLLPCLNGGTCKPLTGTNDNSTFCECPFGFGDHFCDVPCPYGFTGTQCDQRASCNEDLPCLNGGTCKAQQGSGNATVSSCECPPAFGGSLCQTVCPAGYTGQFCDIPVE